ncbi:P-loop containing nucleoside triphosphate hydrolase protein [Lindgomyces ingoldianus]|uniref:P-loop containing nucleoside triphosphate hydrolase protein n=1 Tax=Lindgomyces ingoldianus TaxID=673940 RepID=A0ACB6R6F7_9PLEO|nr:P-loop containing nucleoside triphosphate hydrolase protein [Lindgomyces ingoldianus]KAF2474355.1 P-loop containing nucleoside triphosphate hydrolase protein [Lindgomyces ingoldianus]
MARKNPNIVVTGTPGVGKTTHCELLARNLGFKHLSVNQIVKDEEFHEGRDDETGSWIVDEDKLLDYIEALSISSTGGYILDWHACDLFPERWIDLVVVLRCDSTTLYDRLTARGYKGKKLEENMDSEIMQVLLEEARESYAEEVVVELRSDGVEDVERNCERVEGWVEMWRKDREGGGKEEGQ